MMLDRISQSTVIANRKKTFDDLINCWFKIIKVFNSIVHRQINAKMHKTSGVAGDMNSATMVDRLSQYTVIANYQKTFDDSVSIGG